MQKSQQFAATPLSDKISQFKAVRGDEEADGEDAHTRLAMLEQKVNQLLQAKDSRQFDSHMNPSFERKVKEAGEGSINLGSTFEREDNMFSAAMKSVGLTSGVGGTDNIKIEREGEDSEDGAEEDVQSAQEEVYLTDGQKYCIEAHCYMHAHGVGQSIENAIHYYNTSIGLGESKAMLAMAEYHESGFNMRIDAQKAEEYLWMAAEAGEPEA